MRHRTLMQLRRRQLIGWVAGLGSRAYLRLQLILCLVLLKNRIIVSMGWLTSICLETDMERSILWISSIVVLCSARSASNYKPVWVCKASHFMVFSFSKFYASALLRTTICVWHIGNLVTRYALNMIIAYDIFKSGKSISREFGERIEKEVELV